jgi:quercetin dioxygenase-like cupin family protein
MTTTTTRAPEAFSLLGGTIFVRVDGSETGGDYAVLEQVLPGGMATPLHLHPLEDETFFVIDGEITVLRGDESISAQAGEVVRLPRGVPHALRVDSPSARIIDLVTPAGHEEFFRLAGEPIQELTVALPEDAPDMERIVSAAEQTGLEILGPPPFEG